jgi:hypothetical protein
MGETRDNVVMLDAGIVLQHVGFAPSIGHQADHEFD